MDKRILGDLKYELDCFAASADIIISRRCPEWVLDNFILETFFLHFRILWDFFYPPRKKIKATDVDVRDFVSGGLTTKVSASPLLVNVRRSCNTMLAHLSIGRIAPGLQSGQGFSQGH